MTIEKRISPTLFLIALLLFVFTVSLSAGADNNKNIENEGPGPNPDKKTEEKATKGNQITLDNIISYEEELIRRLKKKQRELSYTSSEQDHKRLESEIAKLNKEISDLRHSFEQIATGVDLSAFLEQSEDDFRWDEEALELLKPVIHELKSITARPRQIERTRGKVEFYKSQLEVVKEGIAKLNNLQAKAKSRELKKHLDEIEKRWTLRQEQLSNQLTIAKLQLAELNKEKEPIIKSIQKIVQGFFRDRGRNMVVSIITFVGVFLLLRLLHQSLIQRTIPKLARRRTFIVRFFDVICQFMTALGATAAAMMILYFSGDWVLLSVSIIFLIGVFWAAKQGLGQYWEQTKLLLNMGSVREGERVFYNGVPWLVDRINYYTRLKNPDLKNDAVRLPIKELMSLNSYPFHHSAPWFPCKTGDWVILADGTRGKVLHQSHEGVQLVMRGGSRKTYMTQTFLDLTPQNLSTGFRLKIPFGLDYKLQGKITTQIPQLLQEAVEQGICDAGHESGLHRVQVEFSSAGASSLDLEIICDFKGEVAELYNKLARLVQRIAVDTANDNGWDIPFNQIVVHRADESEVAVQRVAA
ncbi:hypothetical protein Dvar_42210 [Desulfosarcina variabilis str. Montpellier]|uniref:hypothetical protein n=1 Tax=Desulfosarcina variabilis TaxID=2300 RepID=UPI003AFB7A4D